MRVEVKSEVYNKVAKSIVQTAGARESCWPCPDNRECPENITAGLRKSWPAEPTKDWYEGKVFQGGCITLHGAARQVPFTSVGVYCSWLAQLYCRSEPFFIWNSIVLICIVAMSKPIPHTSGVHLKGESHLQFWVTFLSLQPGQEYRFYMIWVLHFLPNISAFPEKKSHWEFVRPVSPTSISSHYLSSWQLQGFFTKFFPAVVLQRTDMSNSCWISGWKVAIINSK